MPTNGWNAAERNQDTLEPEQVKTYGDETGQSVRETQEEKPRPAEPLSPEPRAPQPSFPEPHSEEIRKIQVDDEDRLAFRVGVNALTLILLGFGIWLLITYVF